jgi:hypothetical protein
MLPVQYSRQYLKATVQMLQYIAAHLQDLVAVSSGGGRSGSRSSNGGGGGSSSTMQVGAEDAHYALGLLRIIAIPFREAWRPQTPEQRAILTAFNMPVWCGQGLSLLQGVESAIRAAWHASRPPIYRRASAADASFSPKDGFRAVYLAVLYLCHTTPYEIYGPLTAAAVAAGLGSAEEQQLYSLMSTLLKCSQQMQSFHGVLMWLLRRNAGWQSAFWHLGISNCIQQRQQKQQGQGYCRKWARQQQQQQRQRQLQKPRRECRRCRKSCRQELGS